MAERMSGGAEPAEELLRRWNVEPRLIEPLAAYMELLERWNAAHNLVRYRTREELVRRHIVESLAGAPRLHGESGTLVDVGSGAGFPGVPLLLARPAWHGVLVEPKRKRWAFLRLVIRELKLDAEARERRFEDLDLGSLTMDAAVSRALGGHAAMLSWARERLRLDGKVLFWTTAETLTALGEVSGWRVVSWPLPGLDTGRLAEFQPSCFT